MKAVIITAAGISSRFNEGIPQPDRHLKMVYHEGGEQNTLLFHLLEKCAFADKIILVGGYRFDDLKNYALGRICKKTAEKTKLVYNPKFQELSSGYSFYIGLEEALKENGLREILFLEGDLDMDDASFQKAVKAEHTVLAYTHGPVYADRSVVLYRDRHGRYRYAFDSCHGLLQIREPFSCILNSGQVWKFTDISALRESCRFFRETDMSGTNLEIIQEYLDRISQDSIELVRMERWANCNTREDYRNIRRQWEENL